MVGVGIFFQQLLRLTWLRWHFHKRNVDQRVKKSRSEQKMEKNGILTQSSCSLAASLLSTLCRYILHLWVSLPFWKIYIHQHTIPVVVLKLVFKETLVLPRRCYCFFFAFEFIIDRVALSLGLESGNTIYAFHCIHNLHKSRARDSMSVPATTQQQQVSTYVDSLALDCVTMWGGSTRRDGIFVTLSTAHSLIFSLRQITILTMSWILCRCGPKNFFVN